MAEAIQAPQLVGYLIPRKVPLLPKGKQPEGNKRAYLEEQRSPFKAEGYLVEEHPQHNQALEEVYLERHHRIKPRQQEVFLEVRIILQLQPKEEDFLEELNNKSQEDFLEASSRLQHLLKEEDFLVKIRLQPLVGEAFLDRMQLQLRVVDYLDRIINNSQQEVVFLANLNNSKIKEALDVEFLSLTKMLEAFPINSSNSHKHSNSSIVL